MKNFIERANIIYEYFQKSPLSREKGIGNSYAGLARLLGISNGKLQNWREKGISPDLKDLVKLHKLFGFSYAWLVNGEGEMFAKDIHDQLDQAQNTLNSEELSNLKNQISELEQELKEEHKLNRQLTTKLLIEGTTETDSAQNVKV